MMEAILRRTMDSTMRSCTHEFRLSKADSCCSTIVALLSGKAHLAPSFWVISRAWTKVSLKWCATWTDGLQS